VLNRLKMTSASGNTDYSDLVQQFCSVTGEGGAIVRSSSVLRW